MQTSPTLTVSTRLWWARLLLAPTERRLRMGWRILLQLLLLTAILGVVQMLVRLGWPRGTDDTLNQLRRILPVGLAFTFATYLARRFVDRRSFSSLGLKGSRVAWLDFVVGFALSASEMALIFACAYGLGWLHVTGLSWQTSTDSSWLWQLVIWLVGVWLVVGFYEELCFRGYWLQNLSEGVGVGWAVLGTALLFGVAHLANPNASWASVIGILLAGLSLAYARLRSGQLWLPIGMHTGWNFFQGTVFGFPVSGIGSVHLIQQTVTGPELIMGGAFGPEAGLIIAPFILFEFVVIYAWTRQRG